MVCLDVSLCVEAYLPPQVGVAGQGEQLGQQGILFPWSDVHFDAAIVGQFRKSSCIGDDDRLADPHRSDQTARGLAGRREAQADTYVGDRHVVLKIVQGNVAGRHHRIFQGQLSDDPADVVLFQV